jgi:hypothetical protein
MIIGIFYFVIPCSLFVILHSLHFIFYFFACGYQYFVDPVAIHVDDLKIESSPLQFITRFRDAFEFMKNKTGEGINSCSPSPNQSALSK